MEVSQRISVTGMLANQRQLTLWVATGIIPPFDPHDHRLIAGVADNDPL